MQIVKEIFKNIRQRTNDFMHYLSESEVYYPINVITEREFPFKEIDSSLIAVKINNGPNEEKSTGKQDHTLIEFPVK